MSSAAYMPVVIRHYGLRHDLTLVAYPLVGSTLRAHLGARFVAPEKVPAELDALVGTRPSAWVFLSRTFHSDPTGEIERYFDTHFMRDEEHAWAGVRVLLYRQRRPTTSDRHE